MTEFRLRWPTDYHKITQPFGVNPQNYAKYGLPGHEGLDIQAPYGSNVYACADGLIYFVGWGSAYGNQIRIDHENNFKTIYAHLLKPLVKVGNRVREGQLIGYADSTGNSTGSHLHLTLKKNGATAAKETAYPNDIVDPTPYLYFVPSVPMLKLIVKANYLNLRTGPGMEFARETLLRYNTILESLELPEDTRLKVGNYEKWINVRFGNLSGWVNGFYVGIVNESS